MEKRQYKKRDGVYWYELLDEDEIIGISKDIMKDIDRKMRK